MQLKQTIDSFNCGFGVGLLTWEVGINLDQPEIHRLYITFLLWLIVF